MPLRPLCSRAISFPGAPVILGRETIRGGALRAIVANSKCSNVATGARGVESARRMAAAAAKEIGSDASRVLVSSTGVIGVRLPIEKIERGLVGMSQELSADPMVGAEGIMTTDTYAKALSVSVPGQCDDHLGREGLGDDRAEHGDDARLHLHRRGRRRGDARPRCCATRCTSRSTCCRWTPTRARRDTCAILANGIGRPRRRARISPTRSRPAAFA